MTYFKTKTEYPDPIEIYRANIKASSIGNMRVEEHESSQPRRNAKLTCRTERAMRGRAEIMARSCETGGCGDTAPVRTRGLAFRGDVEMFGSPNDSNYLEIHELLSKLDPFLR